MGLENLMGFVPNVELAKVKFSHAGTYEAVVNARESFSALFNPTEYGIDQENQISETAIPGLDTPALQFVHGKGRTLNLQLFIDTTEPQKLNGADQTDASLFVAQVTDLLKVEGETHAPPLVKLEWGSLSFIGVLQVARVRYLLFNYMGVPLRATVDLKVKEYRPISVQLRDPRRSSPDRTKVRLLRQGETLAVLAAEEYGDPRHWRVIAERNRIDDPLRIAPGTVLEIPPLPRKLAEEGQA